MEDLISRRRMLREAGAGVDALTTWAQDVFNRADDEDNDELRTLAVRVCEALSPAVLADISSELHEAMAPEFAALLDPVLL